MTIARMARVSASSRGAAGIALSKVARLSGVDERDHEGGEVRCAELRDLAELFGEDKAPLELEPGDHSDMIAKLAPRGLAEAGL